MDWDRARGVLLATGVALIGLIALLMLPRFAQVVALASLPLAAAYPFMKRITWFPQAWLGLTFSWAVLPAYAASAGALGAPAFLAYAGFVAWVFGYDTIYAHQDIDDDALVGVKSTARFFGEHSRLAVGISYAVATLFTLGAALMAAFFNLFTDGPARHGGHLEGAALDPLEEIGIQDVGLPAFRDSLADIGGGGLFKIAADCPVEW